MFLVVDDVAHQIGGHNPNNDAELVVGAYLSWDALGW